MNRKLISLLLAVCMVVSLTPAIALAGERQAAAVNYTDLAATHWSNMYVQTLSDRGILAGYPDGSFKPDALVSRAEFAKMVVLYMGTPMPATAGAPFSDVSAQHWAKEVVAAGKLSDIIGGYPDGSFKPDANITRAEIAKIIVSAWPKVAAFKASAIKTVFPDIGGHWALNDITTLYDVGVAEGYPDGMFKPDRNATRAEAAKLLYLLVTRTPQTTSGGGSSGGGTTPQPEPEPEPGTGILSGQVIVASDENVEFPDLAYNRAISALDAAVGIGGAKISLGSSDTATETVTDDDGFYNLNLQEGTYQIWGSKEDYIPDFVLWTVVPSENTVTVTTLPLVPMWTEVETGTVEGTIFYREGELIFGIGGASLLFRRGLNVKTGDPVATAETYTEVNGTMSSLVMGNHTGNYFVDLPAGNYTVEVIATGFNTSYFGIQVYGDYSFNPAWSHRLYPVTD